MYLGSLSCTWALCRVPGLFVVYLGSLSCTWALCPVPGLFVVCTWALCRVYLGFLSCTWALCRVYLGSLSCTWALCRVPGLFVVYGLGTRSYTWQTLYDKHSSDKVCAIILTSSIHVHVCVGHC